MQELGAAEVRLVEAAGLVEAHHDIGKSQPTTLYIIYIHDYKLYIHILHIVCCVGQACQTGFPPPAGLAMGCW